jgi:hypothetical protein
MIYEKILGAFLIAYFVAMVFCGIPIFYAGIPLNFTLFFLWDIVTNFACAFTEVALGQYLGVGGIYFEFFCFK